VGNKERKFTEASTTISAIVTIALFLILVTSLSAKNLIKPASSWNNPLV
jgi:hypothetical protein